MIRLCSAIMILVFLMGACTKLHCEGRIYFEDGTPVVGALVDSYSIPFKFPDMDLLRLKSDSDTTDEHGQFHLSFEKYMDRYTRSGMIDGHVDRPLFIHVVWKDQDGELSWIIDAEIKSFPFEGRFTSRAPMTMGEFGGRSSLNATDPRYQILTLDLQAYKD